MEIEMTINEYSKIWHKKGDENYWHREDGPAVIYNNGYESWWCHHRCYILEEMPLNLFLAYCKWKYKKNGN